MEGKLILVAPPRPEWSRQAEPPPHHSTTAPKSTTSSHFFFWSPHHLQPSSLVRYQLDKTFPDLSIQITKKNSPEVISSSGDGVDGALQVLQSREDGVMVDDDGFNKLVDVSLAGDLVMALGDRHQGGAETDGQVVGVHHVFLAVLRQAGRKGKQSHLEVITSSFPKHTQD